MEKTPYKLRGYLEFIGFFLWILSLFSLFIAWFHHEVSLFAKISITFLFISIFFFSIISFIKKA